MSEKNLYATFNELYPENCCQGDMPGCAFACPFQLDVRDFISKAKRGSLDAAVKTFRNCVVFPRIVAALCPAPCESRCPRGLVDASIDLHSIEKTAVKLARSLDPINFNVPAKPEKIAIIGGGISGLTCAIRLAAKKYNVTVYEKSDRIGGHLWDILAPEVFLEDIETQGKFVHYDLELNHEIKSLEELADFDAVYIATGKGGNDFGLSRDEDYNPIGGPKGVFIGGSVLGSDTMWAIVDAQNAAINIEKHLKTGFMKFPPEKPRKTRLDMQTELIEPAQKIQALSEDGTYTKEEAVAEAGRCLRCDCTRCVDKCDFMQHWRLNPKQIANFMAFGLADMNLEPKSHNRMVNSCTGCGVCERVCPAHIENGEQMMTVRRRMFEKKMIPPAYHYYWINDMEEAAGEKAYLLYRHHHQPNAAATNLKYVFFPGCQLGASEPRYPKALYELLLQAEPDTAMLMTCCGAPAYWGGNQEKHQEMLERVRKVWKELGEPVLVCACLTCLRMFRQYAADIKVESLYKVLADNSDKIQLPKHQDKEFALVDPCAAKFDETARADVCALLDKMEVPYEQVYDKTEEIPCCSFGGNVYGAEPDMARAMAKKRVEMDDRPYIVYCSNCRDIYATEGKEVLHLADLLANIHEGARPAPHISQRRANRIRAKALVENKEVTVETIMENIPFKLEIPEDVRAHMDANLIYDEDVCRVIDYAEKNNSKFIDEAGNNIAHLVIGLPTVWVEYKQTGENAYAISSCYCHRMTVIEPERDYEDCINNHLDD